MFYAIYGLSFICICLLVTSIFLLVKIKKIKIKSRLPSNDIEAVRRDLLSVGVSLVKLERIDPETVYRRIPGR